MLNVLRAKPLMCFCLTFLVGSCAAVYIPPLPKLILTGIFLFAAGIVGLLGNNLLRRIYDYDRIKPRMTVLLICGFVALGTSFFIFDYRAAIFTDQVGQEDRVTLEITDVVYTSSFGARYYATVTESELFESDFRIILDSADSSYLPRDIAMGTVTYKEPEEDINGYDEQRYALSQKIYLAADDVSLSYHSRNSGFSVKYFFSELNERLCKTIYRYTGEENGSLAVALLLGRKNELPDTVKRDFLRLGILHILCLSGAHLAILSTFVERILLKLRIKRQIRSVVNIAAVILFMALTGFPPSLVRAGIMLILANVAYLIGKNPDYPTSLCLACALIVAFNPYSALDFGLHLSFVAAHSCYISSTAGHSVNFLFMIKKKWRLRKLRRLCNRIIRYIISTAVFNLIITVNMLPLTFLYYGEMSLISLPANLIFIPLITVLLTLSLVFLILAPFVLFSFPLSGLIVSLSQVIVWLSEKLSSLRGIMLPLNDWFTPLFIIPIVILTALCFMGRRKILKRATAVSVCIFVLFLGTVGIDYAVSKHRITAEYVTKGKNDGFLLKSDGQVLVCEVSDASYSFASNLTSHLIDLNCSEIEAYMLTHYHKKHTASLNKLTDNCIVRSFILPLPITETDAQVYGELCAIAEEKGIQIILTDQHQGDTVYFNRAEVEIYPFTLLSRSDHPVIALRLSCDDSEIMYLGGSFNEGDESISIHAENADILIFGGHSPVYKKVFDPQIAEAKTVYVSEYAAESLGKLSPDITEELYGENSLTAEGPIRLD